MAYELKEVRNVDLTSKEYAKYEVYDNHRDTSFSISSATFKLVNVDDGSEAVTGSCTVNNSDSDAEGNTIKTIMAIIDFNITDISVGYYYLIFTVIFSTTEKEIFRVTYNVKDYGANY